MVKRFGTPILIASILLVTMAQMMPLYAVDEAETPRKESFFSRLFQKIQQKFKFTFTHNKNNGQMR